MSKVRTTTVDLFTPDEHAILSEWFERQPPAVAQDIVVDEAISRLGFDKAADLYRRIDAAVAFIVLERAERRPPQWSSSTSSALVGADPQPHLAAWASSDQAMLGPNVANSSAALRCTPGRRVRSP